MGSEDSSGKSVVSSPGTSVVWASIHPPIPALALRLAALSVGLFSRETGSGWLPCYRVRVEHRLMLPRVLRRRDGPASVMPVKRRGEECPSPGSSTEAVESQRVVQRQLFFRSWDKRSDCVQVVIALIVTPDGFPLAYEVMPGNTTDQTTLAGFLEQIEQQYGRSQRVWIMDRGIPTEATLAAMRAGDAPVRYLVGTPKGRLTRLEQAFLAQPWQAVRPSVTVKLLAEEGELYILVRSDQRRLKERGMRRRRLKTLWQRLRELQRQTNTRDQLLLKLGAAKQAAGRAWALVDIGVPAPGEAVTPQTFTVRLRRDRLRQARRREGRYLLRSNLTDEDPATLWRYYMQLTEIEQAFKDLKHDLAIRPVFHQRDARIEAHIFVSFIAYCLHVTLKNLARPHAPGLTPRAILETFATLQMVDVHLPTTDGRHLVLPRHTRPNREHDLLLHQLNLQLPTQPAPRITA